MKKKTVIFLMGAALALGGTFSTGVSAMTYGYDLGDGSVIYTFVGDDGWTDTEYRSEEALTDEERGKLSDWHKEEMRKELAYLEKYGVSYDAEKDQIYYQGKTVRWIIDEQIDDTYTAVKMPDGEIDLYTVRKENYELTGVRVASREEYDERTKEDEMAFCDAYPELAVTECTYACEAYDDLGEWEKKRQEYEEAGIGYDEKDGAWLWNGKMICWLVDENGSMSTNGSQQAKEAKIYVIVKRNADGSIQEVKQVTIEEVMKEQILLDEGKNEMQEEKEKEYIR